MKTSEVRARLRAARPATEQAWAKSDRGRAVRDRLLESVGRDAAVDGGATRGRPRRWAAVSLVVAVSLAVVGLVVGPRLVGAQLDADEDRGVSATALNTYSPDDVAFWKPFGAGGGAASEAERYATLNGAASSATAVVVAEVVEVVKTRVVVGEVPSDRLHTIGITIRPLEVLAGALPEGDRDELTVEFLSGSVDPSDRIAELNSNLPDGQAVWFLRSKAEEIAKHRAYLEKRGREPSRRELEMFEAEKPFYRVVSSQGLLLQGEHHVIGPIVWSDAGMVEQATQYAKLSELVKALRNSK